jgi:flagellar motor switch protein FliM
LVEILSQAEIEALLASLANDSTTRPEEVDAPVARAAVKPPERRTIAYELYDFRRPDKLSKDQLRTLQMIHETFARLFASSLSAYLRVSTHVDLVSVEQVPYDEYMRSLTNSIINVISLPPFNGQAILELEFNIALSMIDRLLGGPGNMVKNNTVLTEIEKGLTESIVNRSLKDLRTAWEGIVQINPRRDLLETQSHFIQIVPPNDIVVSILFEVKIGDLRGAMSLCIPYLLLKPITAKMSAQRWFASSTNRHLGQNAAALAERLASTQVTCICRLGSARVSTKDLVNLREGDTLILNRKCTDEVDLMIGGHAKFKGKPGTAGRKVALHINRVVTDDPT